jgi:hypothetical protein
MSASCTTSLDLHPSSVTFRFTAPEEMRQRGRMSSQEKYRKKYREEAARLRAAAFSSRDVEMLEKILLIARLYDELADDIEEHEETR